MAGEAAAVTIASAILAPLATKHLSILTSKIQERRFKINKIDANIHCTLYNKFKKDYSLDFINENILKSISKFKVDEKDCTYAIENTSFTIIPQFAYTQPDLTHLGLQESEYKMYPIEQETETFIPGVSGVTIYVFFQQNTKNSIVNCQTLLNYIGDILLRESDVKQQGKFLYIDVKNEVDCNKILKAIEKEYNTDGYKFENKSGMNTEIKIRYSDSIFRILSKLLRA